jgi:hypothetical protein
VFRCDQTVHRELARVHPRILTGGCDNDDPLCRVRVLG